MSKFNNNNFPSAENAHLLSDQAPDEGITPDPVAVLSANMYPHNSVYDSEEEDFTNDRSRKRGAGIACGTLGCFIGGPILAVIAGVGATHVFEKEGIMGDVSRAAGDVAISVQDKAKEVSEKHKLRTKMRNTAENLY